MRISIHQDNMLKVLKNTFSKSTDLIVELLQNSRRAGATEVSIDTLGNKVTFTDNGSGITDFNKLLTIADSGYTEEVIEEEHPFGIGFLAAMFKAKEITIRSNNKLLIMDTEKVLAGENVQLTDADEVTDKTVITLYFENEKAMTEAVVCTDMSRLLTYFPIDVIVNGTLIPAYKPDKKNLITTDIGVLDITVLNKAEDVCDLPYSVITVYQGMKIELNNPGRALRWNKFLYFSSGDFIILHLPNSTHVRMPERDYCLDYEVNDVSVKLMGYMLDFAKIDKAKMTPKQFMSKWGKYLFSYIRDREAYENTIAELVNDIDYIPSILLQKVDNILPSKYVEETGIICPNPDDVISKEDVLKEPVYELLDTLRDDIVTNLDLLWVEAEDAYVIDDTFKIPKGHWLEEHVQAIDYKDLSCEANLPEDEVVVEIPAGFAWKRLHVVEEVHIKYKNNEPITCTNYVVSADDIYIIKGSYDYEDLVYFLDGCKSEYNDFQESIFIEIENNLKTGYLKLTSNGKLDYQMQRIKDFVNDDLHATATFETNDNTIVIVLEE